MKKTLAVGISEKMLTKKECMAKARQIIREGRISQMSDKALAHELYFHAWFQKTFKRYSGHNRTLDHMLKSADPADLEDGGDTLLRRCVYWIIWHLTKGR